MTGRNEESVRLAETLRRGDVASFNRERLLSNKLTEDDSAPWFPYINLENIRLHQVNFEGAFLQFANLHNSMLRFADLRRCCLQNADISDSDLDNINLQNANLTAANLQGASLKNANLFKARLFETDLRDANLSEANLQGACFFRTVISPQTNLNTATASDLSKMVLRSSKDLGTTLRLMISEGKLQPSIETKIPDIVRDMTINAKNVDLGDQSRYKKNHRDATPLTCL